MNLYLQVLFRQYLQFVLIINLSLQNCTLVTNHRVVGNIASTGSGVLKYLKFLATEFLTFSYITTFENIGAKNPVNWII